MQTQPLCIGVYFEVEEGKLVALKRDRGEFLFPSGFEQLITFSLLYFAVVTDFFPLISDSFPAGFQLSFRFQAVFDDLQSIVISC